MSTFLCRLSCVVWLWALTAPGCRSDPESAAPRQSPTPAAQYYLGVARAAIEAGDLEAAVLYARRAEKEDPSAADAALILAASLDELHRWSDAEAAYLRVLQLHPGYSEAWLKLGNIAYAAGRFRTSAERYRRAAEDLQTADAWHNLGAAYLSLQEIESAREAFDQALTRKPGFALAHSGLVDVEEYNGNLEAATSHAEAAIRLGLESASIRKKLGLLYLRQGLAREAEAALRGAAERYPLDPEVQFSLGQTYRRLGDSTAADRSFRRHKEARDATSRIDRLQVRLKEHPADSSAMRSLATLLMLSGRHEEAVEVYHRILETAPEELDARIALGSIYAAQGKAARAEQEYRFVLRRDSMRAAVWMYLGLLQKKEGREAEALAALSAAKRLEPRLASRIEIQNDSAL